MSGRADGHCGADHRQVNVKLGSRTRSGWKASPVWGSVLLGKARPQWVLWCTMVAPPAPRPSRDDNASGWLNDGSHPLLARQCSTQVGYFAAAWSGQICCFHFTAWLGFQSPGDQLTPPPPALNPARALQCLRQSPPHTQCMVATAKPFDSASRLSTRPSFV